MVRGRRRGQTRRKPEPEHDLPQSMADFLIEIPKFALEADMGVDFRPGMNVEIDFRNDAEQEEFRLMIHRSGINIRHAKYELLARNSVVLLRFEIEGPPHDNPDGQHVPCPHLHQYREGYADKWARPIGDEFGDTNNLLACLHGFLRYCNAVQVPPIRPVRGLFP